MCRSNTSLPTLALLLLLLLLLAPAGARAQRERERDAWNPSSNSVEVSGRVNYSGGVGPAPNVTVRLERFGSGVLEQMATDPQGRFRFAGLGRGQYVVVAAAPCYLPAQQQVELQIIFRSYIELELRPDTSAGCAGAGAGGSVVDARVPAPAREEFERAQSARRERKPERVVEHLERAVSIHPDFFAAQMMLGTAHTEAARWERADSALRRALRIDPRSAPAHVALADLQRRRKNYAEAEKTLAEALKLDAQYWPGHFMLARVHWDAGDVVRAGNAVGRTLQLKPDYAEAHLLAGNVLLKVRQPARALAEFEEYLRLAPDGEVAPQARDIVKRLKSSLASSK